MRRLSHQEIVDLHAKILDAGQAGSRQALLAGLSKPLVAGLPIDARPNAQLLSDLHALNDEPEALHDLLLNAVALSRGTRHNEPLLGVLQSLKEPRPLTRAERATAERDAPRIPIRWIKLPGVHLHVGHDDVRRACFDFSLSAEACYRALLRSGEAIPSWRTVNTNADRLIWEDVLRVFRWKLPWGPATHTVTAEVTSRGDGQSRVHLTLHQPEHILQQPEWLDGLLGPDAWKEPIYLLLGPLAESLLPPAE